MLTFSEACERNKEPILTLLKNYFGPIKTILEIGSGSGQHGVHFAGAMPHLTWQTSDLVENHPGIRTRIQDSALTNLLPPLALDVTQLPWPTQKNQAIFTANTLHIMPRHAVQCFFQGIDRHLDDNGLVVIYGPFNYGGRYTSESNARFDEYLKMINPEQGIRDFEKVNELAMEQNLKLLQDHPMPANNQLLVWQHQPS